MILSCLILSSCFFNDIDRDYDESYKIEFGFNCGWCAGSQFINLVDGRIRYDGDIPCGEDKGRTVKVDEFASEQWDRLISSYNHDTFLQLEYNQCNVCVDGCDEIIRITKNDITHELSYNPGDTIPGVEELQEKLRMLMLDYLED